MLFRTRSCFEPCDTDAEVRFLLTAIRYLLAPRNPQESFLSYLLSECWLEINWPVAHREAHHVACARRRVFLPCFGNKGVNVFLQCHHFEVKIRHYSSSYIDSSEILLCGIEWQRVDGIVCHVTVLLSLICKGKWRLLRQIGSRGIRMKFVALY